MKPSPGGSGSWPGGETWRSRRQPARAVATRATATKRLIRPALGESCHRGGRASGIPPGPPRTTSLVGRGRQPPTLGRELDQSVAVEAAQRGLDVEQREAGGGGDRDDGGGAGERHGVEDPRVTRRQLVAGLGRCPRRGGE